MTVKEFKKLVQNIPESQDDWVVVVSRDEEGNGFNEFNFLSNDDGEICTQYYDELEGELRHYNEDDYEDFEEFVECVKDDLHLKPCIVLWP
jgi:hypothetical protein